MLPTHFVGDFRKTLIGTGFRVCLQVAIDSRIVPQAVELALFFLPLLAPQLRCRAVELDLLGQWAVCFHLSKHTCLGHCRTADINVLTQ